MNAIEQAIHAIHAWLSERLGIPVVWADQNAPRPTRPFATARLSGLVPVGRDELRTSTDLSRPAGEEVGIAACGQRSLTLSVNVFSERPQGPSALELLAASQASLGLPSVRAQLRAAGLAVLSAGAVQDLSLLEDSTRVERAQMDVRLALASEVAERTGYIATVDVAGDLA